jgi:DNA-binding transcriptional MerR regulator
LGGRLTCILSLFYPKDVVVQRVSIVYLRGQCRADRPGSKQPKEPIDRHSVRRRPKPEVSVHRGQAKPGRAPATTVCELNLSLAKLNKLHGLTDSAGNPLRFSQTHRLRHIRATELFNDGVAIHVVQRYLGHKSQPAPDTETSIVAALRARLTAKDTQIAELKAALRERDRTISTLHGKLERMLDGRANSPSTTRPPAVVRARRRTPPSSAIPPLNSPTSGGLPPGRPVPRRIRLRNPSGNCG